MGDLTSTRPASGAPIATAWGAEVHDALEGLQSGYVQVVVAAGVGQLVVTFPRPYASLPVVVATPAASSDAWIVSLNANSGTSYTGFTLRVSHKTGSTANSGTINIMWIAVGQPA